MAPTDSLSSVIFVVLSLIRRNRKNESPFHKVPRNFLLSFLFSSFFRLFPTLLSRWTGFDQFSNFVVIVN